MRRIALLVAVALALAAVAAASTVGQRREADAALGDLPSSRNPSARGLAAAFEWLELTGRHTARLEAGDRSPSADAVWLLAAPGAPLDEPEAAAVEAHAARGGLVIWALGDAPQPALARRLGAVRVADGGERLVEALAPHPLFEGLRLRAGGSAVTCARPEAHPVAGTEERPAAISLPVGRGEVLLLAGTELLDDARVGAADALTLWVRLAARGPVVFDERFLRPPVPVRRRIGSFPALMAAQALLASLLLLLAVGRRHGAVRPPPPAGARRTARDYLASLAALYRRTGAEPELAATAWRRLRRWLELASGVPAGLPGEEAARRLEGQAPLAAEALRRGETALGRAGPGQLLAVARAAADVEAGLRRRAHPSFDRS